jgi:DNA-directed RNA polymerase subunit RPC12/RpoP
MATTITCHCGIKFDTPPDLKERRVNCPTCGSVIFLKAENAAIDDEEDSGTYDLMVPVDGAENEKHIASVEGIPDWLDQYRSSPGVKKADRDKTLELIARLSNSNATFDPLGTALYVAATHADAETSIAALTTVAMSGHPVYGKIALTFLEHIGPSDAAGAQQVVILLRDAKDAAAEQVVIMVLRTLGPTPVVHVRSLIDVLESKHTALYIWALQCLTLIGPPAKRVVETLHRTLKIANHHLRVATIDALGAIARDGERVVPLLLQALKHQSPDYRMHAAMALGRFGAGAAKAVAPLKEVLKDQDPDVRQAATDALQEIAAAVKGAVVAPAPAAPANGKAAEQILIVCSCGKRLKAAAELAGKKVKCPACKGVIAVPALSAAGAAAPAGESAPLSTAPSAAPVGEKECTTCLATVPFAAVLCVQCGHDFRK